MSTVNEIDNSLPLEISHAKNAITTTPTPSRAFNNNKLLSKTKRINESNGHAEHELPELCRYQVDWLVYQSANSTVIHNFEACNRLSRERE